MTWSLWCVVTQRTSD